METKKIMELEEKLANYQGKDRIVTSHELQAYYDTLPIQKTMSTGIHSLDRILDGVELGELIVFTGPTGGGKTSILISITKNISEENKCVWFTLEVPQRQFLKKFGDKLPEFYIPNENVDNNMQWIIERIVEAKVKFGVNIVFIDHLHFLFSIDRFNGKNLSLELGDIVAKLKQIAIKYNIIIFLVAHSTDPKEGTSREPKMSDVRDSGMIIRLADTVCGVWRIPNNYNGEETTVGEIGENDTRAKLRVWKNRRMGKLGKIIFNVENAHYKEVDTTKEPKAPTKRQQKFRDMLDEV